MTREIKKKWGIAYLNESRQIHRENDKSSLIYFNGNIYFCKKDKYHRQGKPSIIRFNGTLEYYEEHEIYERIQR